MILLNHVCHQLKVNLYYGLGPRFFLKNLVLFMNIIFEVKIESKLVDRFLKLEGVFSLVGTVEDFEGK